MSGSANTKPLSKDLPSSPAVTTPANPFATSTIPKPPSPAEAKSESKPNLSTPPTATPPIGTGDATVDPPKPRKKPRRFTRLFLYLATLLSLGYGAGTYYALVSDNWHDFWTEYVPFGEDAVAYFEEREFRRRFAHRDTTTTRLHKQVHGEPKVTIQARAGVTARPADEGGEGGNTGLSQRGRHFSSLEDNKHKEEGGKAGPPVQAVAATKAAEKPSASSSHALMPKDSAKSEDTSTKEGSLTPKAEAKPAPKPEPKSEPKQEPKPEPKLEQAKVEPIDPLNVNQATEPAVQDAVKMLNDIITVINADGNASTKYSSAIQKAKEDVQKVIADIDILKQAGEKAAQDREKKLHEQFDVMARQLLQRQESVMNEQEMRWKEEYEAERQKLSEAYENKLRAEMEAAKKLQEQKLKNELLEQQITLRRDFTSSVRDRVEKEREGRLGRLDEWEKEVEELERLTAEWNAVVGSNLRTQHLLIAVEALRSKLEDQNGEGATKPFIEELAALKEVADGDPVVDAAIASINPISYQRGIPSQSQLIDRFRRVAQEVRKVELLPENAGVASHVASAVLSKLMFKKKGVPVGEDVESVLARAEGWLEEGDFDAAAREVNGLSGWAKVLCKDWLGDVRRVLEVKQALDVSFVSRFIVSLY